MATSDASTADDPLRPGLRGVESEPAGVAEGIEHAFAGAEFRARVARFLPLVEVETGLLTFGEIDEEGNAVFLNRQFGGWAVSPPQKAPS